MYSIKIEPLNQDASKILAEGKILFKSGNTVYVKYPHSKNIKNSPRYIIKLDEK